MRTILLFCEFYSVPSFLADELVNVGLEVSKPSTYIKTKLTPN